MKKEKGFINIVIVILLISATLMGVWGVEYVKRLNAEKEFKQRVDKLTLSAASFQALTMNGVSVLNDGILFDDATAAVIAITSVVVGVVALVAGGEGLDIMKDGFDISKKVVKIGNKIEKFEKKWVSIAPVLTYIPYLIFYRQQFKEHQKKNMLFLPIPFIPDFADSNSSDSSGGGSGSGSGGSDSMKKYRLKIDVKWALNKVIAAIVKQLFRMADKKIMEIKEKEAKKYDRYINKKAKEVCKDKRCKKKIIKRFGSKGLFYKDAEKLFEKGWKGVKKSILAGINNGMEMYNEEEEEDSGINIPIPAVLSDNFFKVQRIGTFAIWKNEKFSSVKWLNTPGEINIPFEIQFARAMPYSDMAEGGLPLKPDWKGVFIPPDLFDALGAKNETK